MKQTSKPRKAKPKGKRKATKLHGGWNIVHYLKRGKPEPQVSKHP